MEENVNENVVEQKQPKQKKVTLRDFVMENILVVLKEGSMNQNKIVSKLQQLNPEVKPSINSILRKLITDGKIKRDKEKDEKRSSFVYSLVD